MKKSFTKIGIYSALLLSLAGSAKAQIAADTTAEFKPHGQLWGYAFGDFAYKGSTDNNLGTAAAPAYRGATNQYTGMPASSNMFQFRRIYLGYNYDISKKFSAEFLLAAEDDFNAGLDGQNGAVGDVLSNGKFTPYVKLANVRWKNIFPNSDLVIGQQSTPTFAKTGRNDQTAEEVWGYRSIERTITDILRTPSYDMGVSLQGWFGKSGKYGYTLMAANGTSDKPETDNYKAFYGDVYAKFLNKRLIVQLYQDYQKLNWGTYVPGAKAGVASLNGPWYHDRNMTKLFVAWNTKLLSAGVEVFQNTLMGDVKVTGKDGSTYYRNTNAMGYSAFVRGRIYTNERTNATLGFFARYDNFDPTGNLSNIVNDKNTKTYAASVAQYEPTTKQQFVTFGLDFQPIKNVHIMPNVWLNTYKSDLGASTGDANSSGTKYSTMNGLVNNQLGTDAVYRITFYYIYGK
jgi:hypothetical protein